MLIGLPVVDAILEHHAPCIATDLPGYRNHVYRLINLVDAMAPLDRDDQLVVAIAAAFHDIGIWTANTWDYIQPSLDAAEHWLDGAALSGTASLVASMIENHHKLRACPSGTDPLVELFRRADWCDVTLGHLRSGVTRVQYGKLLALFPSAGFHRRLLVLAARHARRWPFRPFPMLRF